MNLLFLEIELPKSIPIILKFLLGNKAIKTLLETGLRSSVPQLVSEEMWDKNYSPLRISNCTNRRKPWIERPKWKYFGITFILGNKGLKSVLETAIRSVIVPIVLEQLWDKNCSPIGHKFEAKSKNINHFIKLMRFERFFDLHIAPYN